MRKKTRTQKRSDAQIRAIRRSYAIRASIKKREAELKAKEKAKKEAKKKKEKAKKEKAKQIDKNTCSPNKLNNYTRIASDFENDKKPEKKLSDYARKELDIKNDSVNPNILDNPWNVHHARTDKHPKAVLARKGDDYLIAHTTTEINDKDAKVRIQDGLFDNQKEPTFVKLNALPIPKGKLQSKIRKARITNRDKLLIYDSMKDRDSNKEKYKNLGNKKDRS